MISVITKLSVRVHRRKYLQAKFTLVTLRSYSSDEVKGKTYELYNLEESPSENVELELKDALFYYKQMLLIRKMENVSSQLYMERLIRGFLHLYSGQEACAVGIKAIMKPEDTVITSYRCHGWAVVMGETVRAVLAELLGKSTGSARGKGGSMHMYYKNMYGGSGIVGAHVPLGIGIGFAHKYKNNGAVSFTVFGDGAFNQGQTHEALNIAKLQSLPVVFVVENNQYGMGTSCSRSSASTEYYKRIGYLPGLRVDGNDVLAVREGARFSRDFVLKDGPIVFELNTYRYFGHSMSDPGYSYRSKDEIKSWRENKDPIKKFESRIMQSGLVKEEELKKIDEEAKKEVDLAVKQAKEDPPIEDKELIADCYVRYPDAVKLPGYWKFSRHTHFGFHKSASASWLPVV